MSDTRFGVTGLNKTNKSVAANEEIIIHKETGEYLIKSASGDYISYDQLARQKNAINTITDKANLLNMIGELNIIYIPTLELPNIVSEEVNILDGDTLLKSGNLKRVLFEIDLDCVEKTSTADILANREANVTLELKYYIAATSTTVLKTYTGQLSAINKQIMYAADVANQIDLTQAYVYLSKLSFSRNAILAGKDLKYILHNLLVIVD